MERNSLLIKGILFFLTILPISAHAQSGTKDPVNSNTVIGYVYEDLNGNGKKDRKEKGIEGVAVSDGRNIVLTDKDGKYELPVSNHCVIFVIKPKGYISPVNDKNQPQCWYIHKPEGSPELQYKGSDPTGELPKSLDFAMRAYDDPVNFTFYAFGDSQPYSLREVEYFRKKIVEEARMREGVSFGITLGDNVGDHLDLQPHYLDAVKDMGIPWYHVIGNHDRNYDGKVEEYANETFEKNFGPSTYAFRYGDAHFILLDDIFMHQAPKHSPYKGGFSERQFEFMENYAKLVNKGELIVFSYHIPISYKEGQFLDEHRRRFFKIFEGHNVLGLSAHTHIQMQLFYGEDLGWTGEKPFHEYNVGTSNGDWYSGKIMEDGTPDATMRDGTPQGYAIVRIDGDKYIFDYKVAGKPEDYVMSIYSPKVVPFRHGGKYPIYVNFFLGAPTDVVEYKINDGKWKKMSYVKDEADPTFVSLVQEWDRTDVPMNGRRPNSVPTMCTHLWKAVLDNKLEPGEHKVEIRATDMFGRKYRETYFYRTASVEQ